MGEIESNKLPANSGSRAIAIVSGKGGSGKTMVAAVMAQVLDRNGLPTLITDTDTATAGLTYYLALKLAPNISVGLVDAAVSVERRWEQYRRSATIKEEHSDFGLDSFDEFVKERGLDHEADFLLTAIQTLRGYDHTEFLGLGDHRRFFKDVQEEHIPIILEPVINQLRKDGRWMVVDCRGGIDQDSLAVCRAVDDIILVAETDTTSFQTTQHLVDILSMHDIAHKLRGFVINKVFDDPSTVARSGTAAFRSRYLSAIPFDIQATRAFLVGEVPSSRSLFGIHVWEALHRGYPEFVDAPEGRPWGFKEFRDVGLTDPDSTRGGVMATGLILAVGGIALARGVLSGSIEYSFALYIIITLVLIGLIGSAEITRKLLGRALNQYSRFLRRVMLCNCRRRN